MTAMSVAGLDQTRAPRGAATCFLRYDENQPALLVLGGDIDARMITRLRDALAAAVRLAGEVVVIDLSRVRSMETAAVRALLTGRRRAERANVRLVLRRPSPAVTRLLACTGLSGTFSVD